MAESYPCPICGGDVPTQIATSGPYSIDKPPAGETTLQHANCPRCGAALVRYVQADDPGWEEDPKRRG